ncbi:MAG: chaperone modulator CbpM [Gammaproteobacteria bacterium]|nr:chaperone modulator CbpM [Gammaproteobacteria bacterium]
MAKKSRTVSEFVVETNETFNLEQLSDAINAEIDFITQLVEHELLEPEGSTAKEWQFDIVCYQRAKRAYSFHNDLDVNMAGIALALDLLDKIERLEKQLNQL